jgi:hypothetical protein
LQKKVMELADYGGATITPSQGCENNLNEMICPAMISLLACLGGEAIDSALVWTTVLLPCWMSRKSSNSSPLASPENPCPLGSL